VEIISWIRYLNSPNKKAKYIRVIEILLALILVDGRETITSKARTFVVLELETNVALIEYSETREKKKIDNIYT
jgi:hypothetical protein